MRRLTTILAMAAMVAAATLSTGCEITEDTTSKTSYLTVESAHWKRFPEAGPFEYYFYNFENRQELTPYLLENGIYHMYYNWWDNNISVMEPLPHIIYHKESDGYMWEEHMTCDYDPYTITFYIRYSDFIERTPPTMDFRFVAFW